MYVGLIVLHAACIILYTCKSSLYFILVFFFGGSLLRASWKISFFFSLNVLPSENKDYYYYYYYYYIIIINIINLQKGMKWGFASN